MNKLFIISLLSFVSVASSTPAFSYSLNASDDVNVTMVSLEHGEPGYDIEVGQEVLLKPSEFKYTPEDATNKSVKYRLADDSYEGDLPPAMFSKKSTYSEIIIKGLMVGDFKVYFYAADGAGAYTTTTFHVFPTGELPENVAQTEGYTTVKTPYLNNVPVGTTSLYEDDSENEVENPTPLFRDGKFDISALATFVSQIFTVNAFVVLGIILIGLLFLYILFYSIKKAVWKHRR